MTSDSYFEDVGKFHKKFDLPRLGDGRSPTLLEEDDLEFRVKFMQEELNEFVRDHAANDLEGSADALADLVYVALGTAHLMGLPLDEVWRAVQRANMTKVRAESADDPLSTRKHRLDVVKPPGFVPPDHHWALERARNRALLDRVVGDDKTPLVSRGRGGVWWDRWFLRLAAQVATASKDPSTKVGAVVVAENDRRRVAFGYNGFPPGIWDDDRLMGDRETKYQLMMHAERNALDNATFSCVGGTMYCEFPPCIECAKSIVSKRLRRVVTLPHPPIEKGRWTEQIPIAQKILKEARVDCHVVSE